MAHVQVQLPLAGHMCARAAAACQLSTSVWRTHHHTLAQFPHVLVGLAPACGDDEAVHRLGRAPRSLAIGRGRGRQTTTAAALVWLLARPGRLDGSAASARGCGGVRRRSRERHGRDRHRQRRQEQLRRRGQGGKLGGASKEREYK